MAEEGKSASFKSTLFDIIAQETDQRPSAHKLQTWQKAPVLISGQRQSSLLLGSSRGRDTIRTGIPNHKKIQQFFL
jgi:hypothetical protein